MKQFQAFCLVVSGFLVAGCSKLPPPEDDTVSCTVADRIGSHVEWRQGSCQDEHVHAFISSVLCETLTPDAAIQIALLNNPKVQATFEALGMSQADWVEAGLLSNPAYEVEIRYPHVKGLKTNIEYLITTSLLDVFLIPLRKRLAGTEFQQTRLRVSNEILDLAFEVRETYYALVTEFKKAKCLQFIVDLKGMVGDISTEQLEAGNINALEFQFSQARFFEAELEWNRSQVEIIRLKEKLNRLIGFSSEVCLTLPEELPQREIYSFDLCALESMALENRLDLQVAKFEIIRMTQMLGLKEGWTYTNLNVGLAGEREPGGANLIGPGFSGEIPIFNYGQAARMRLYAQLRQAQDKLSELEIRVLSEVREAYKVLTRYAKIIHDYEARLLPMQHKIVASSEGLYNVMGLGVDQLIENKCQQIIANHNYIESLKRYLIAEVELDRALGGYLFNLKGERVCEQGLNHD